MLLNRHQTSKLEHVPRSANKLAFMLANLATTLPILVKENMNVLICNPWVIILLNEKFEADIIVVSAPKLGEEH